MRSPGLLDGIFVDWDGTLATEFPPNTPISPSSILAELNYYYCAGSD